MQKYIILFLAALIAVTSALQCFQCVSNEDSACAVNDESSLAKFKKTCEPLKDGDFKGKAAVGCRKITQSVQSEYSVVRECAYSGGPVDGLKKTGNHGIQLYYYQCENASPDQPCNTVAVKFSAITVVLSILIYCLFH
ncbi:unnamed protein product [Caenorhabditis bovis]|uniref:Uncharacterized protein n=1 Tax=Caenorhabditis bovis TaxID=2654633 RepID=A0A8S1ELC6_9PELO|nr:unnamed protein product [Caenorhabditis bovis]